jgi:hypothetical protein
MDKLKLYLSVVEKYQFWLLCGVMLLVSLGCWWWATGDLAAKIQTRKSAVESTFRNIEAIVNQPSHPSQKVSEEINRQDKALKDGVCSAWEILYNKQKEKNPFPTKVLGADFESQFENLKPKAELDPRYRERYQNFIREYLPKLQALIDVRRPKEEKGAADGGRIGDRPAMPGPGMGRSGGDVEWVGIVDWDQGDYSRLLRCFEWQDTPSTLAVVLAQEDLWVYEAVLRVIKNVNEGAANQAGAAVKRIDALEIGHDAVSAWKGAAPGGAGPSGAKDDTDAKLIDNRYVDDKGMPLPAAALERQSEFKMMPIRMCLLMDQRRLPKLLVECANSNMPIEVRGIRILKTQGQPLDLASMTATPGGQGNYQPASHAVGHNIGGPPGGQSDSPEQETVLYDVPVEIYATICIYNPPPPDRERPTAAPSPVAPPQR